MRATKTRSSIAFFISRVWPSRFAAATPGEGSRVESAAMRAVVITCSDAAARGVRDDVSGPAVRERLQAAGFEVEQVHVIGDERRSIAMLLREEIALGSRLIVTTGGTGVAPRDVTPEACADVCDRRVEGFGELMRAAGRESTPLASLSRGGAWTAGTALVVNLPGSPRGAVESLDAVLHLIPHALELLTGAPVQIHPRE